MTELFIILYFAIGIIFAAMLCSANDDEFNAFYFFTIIIYPIVIAAVLVMLVINILYWIGTKIGEMFR